LIAVFDFTKSQYCTNLSQGFNYQNARHHRRSGKVSLEKRFVDTDLLDANDTLLRNQLHDSIHQEKRVAVRQEFLNFL
jgi:hypothetical protein